MKRVGAAAAALVVLAGLAATGGYFYLRSSLQSPSGAVEVPSSTEGGPEAQVHVRVDDHGVPHVRADTLPDALFAQGWLHASHRLWQMELLKRSARGRLAQIFGAQALPVDRLSRTLDLWGAAGRALRSLEPRERALLSAYAAGVNARIRSWEGAWPPEFVILGIEPGNWSARASLAVGKVMSLDLTFWQTELSRWNASRVLPPEKLRFLEAGYPEWAPTILEDSVPLPEGVEPTAAGIELPAAGDTAAAPASGTAARSRSQGTDRWDPFAFLGRRSARRASNAWVVGGEHTRSGHPIVANDMHLGLRAPATWYLAAISAGRGYAAGGLTLPGVPGVVVGFNRGVAWGFTNGMVDDIDFAREEVGPEGRRYRDGDTLRPFAVRPETIRVRGRESPVLHRVRSTTRGPVITDAVEGLDGTLAARWVPAETTGELRGLLGMNRARTAAAFDSAVREFASPHQNVVFADSRGNVGYRLSGRIPVRPGWSGALPVPASRWEGGWRGFWPPAAHPAGEDPERGFFATANNLQAPGLHGVVGGDYPLPFRARRLVDRLSGAASWTPDATASLSRDVRSLFAARVRDRAVAAARRAGADSAAAVLSAWDRRVDTAARGAPLFYAWLYALRDRIAADEYGGGGRWAYFPDGALLRILEGEGGDAWVDDVGTEDRETLAELEAAAMEDAVGAVRGRTWGELHREVHRHPLGRVAWLDALFGFDVGPYPGPGAPHTLRPDDYARWEEIGGESWRPPWISDYGPTERFVAELRPDGPEARFLLPTGQSGNPFSDHYRDMSERWRSGELIPVSLPRDREDREGGRSYVLTPR
ncbi:MAG: penicillin acylase family protein [Candidatus Palauibacterales bacterium]|nr:penicillin acylase family protein [Candidatus Palauibacterales bacterium]